MITKQQLRILSVFMKEPFAELTFKQIKKESGQKSNNIVQIALKEFQKQGLVKTKKTGNVIAYSLNFGNNLTIGYLNLLNESEIKRKKFPAEILAEMQNKISKYTDFFILIIFGSYVKGKTNEKSDLDIAVIVESEKTRKEVMPYIETIKRRELIKIDCHIFTEKEFLDLLQAEEENLGKQIYKSSIVFYGFIEYLNLVRKTK